MRLVADLHVHSRWSRATSREADLAGYWRWARVKGINVVGTGDFTHPRWMADIAALLVERDGLLELKEPPKGSPLECAEPADIPVRFLLTAEISSIYRKRGETRKVHSLIGVPAIEDARKLGIKLSAIGNVASDGRPILGLDPKALLEMLLETSSDGFLIPAHIWTPWFSLFGSRSGFDRIEDCFEELTPTIFALETGLSSDPPMNWRWSALDRFRLVSNSDAHSPANLGREANLFDTDLSYSGLVGGLRTGAGFLGTFEFYPEEGKYHFDGHRKCRVCMDPEETVKKGGSCPVCGKPLTVGVLSRAWELADRPHAIQPRAREGFRYLIPLPELLAEMAGTGPGSKAVAGLYEKVIRGFGNEYGFLFDAGIEDIESSLGPLAAEAVRRMREGRVNARPGYDGEFGVIRVFDHQELDRLRGQDELFAAPRSVLARGAGGASKGVKGLRRGTEPAAEKPVDAVSGASEPAEYRGCNEILDAEQRAVLETRPGALGTHVLSAAHDIRLVSAGPGSGKTRVLTQWIARVVESGAGSPGEILALTFTNRAASEMKERLVALLGERGSGITAATFHSFCFSILRRSDPTVQTVFNAENRIGLLRMLFPTRNAGRIRSLSERIERCYEGVDQGESELREALDAYDRELRRIGGADVASLVNRCVELLRKDAALISSLHERIRFIAVDELQDINGSQYSLLCLLSGFGEGAPGAVFRTSGRQQSYSTAGAPDETSGVVPSAGASVLCIGDPDQSIYGFRGSDRELFFRFRDDAGAACFSLSRNYRSTDTIVHAAASIISAIHASGSPTLSAARSGGDKIRILHASDPTEEGNFIAATIKNLVGGVDSVSVDRARDEKSHSFSDIAVLFRTRAVRDALLPSLIRAGFPITFRDSTPLAAEEPFRYLVAAMRLLLDPRDPVALHTLREHVSASTRAAGARGAPAHKMAAGAEQIEDFLTRRESLLAAMREKGICAVMDDILENIVSFDGSVPEVSLGEETLRDAARDFGDDLAGFLGHLSLCAFEHTGQRAAEKVTLLTFHAAKGLEYPVVFIAGAEEGITPLPDDLDEERRLFYVAATRAMDALYITHCDQRRMHGKLMRMTPSRFIREIPPECVEEIARTRPSAKRSDGQLSLFG